MKILVNLNCLGDSVHRHDLKHQSFDMYHEAQADDTPVIPLIRTLQALSEQYEIVVYTTIKESYRYQVEQWLVDCGVPAEDVLMKAEDDWTRDYEFLIDLILTTDDIELVFEENPRIIEELREQGEYVVETI